MKLEDLVIGGVYACEKTFTGHSGVYTTAAIREIQRNFAKAQFGGNGGYKTYREIKAHELGECIGYDAKWSDEYQATRKQLVTAQERLTALGDLNSYATVNKIKANLDDLLVALNADIDEYAEQLKKIESKSWGVLK